MKKLISYAVVLSTLIGCLCCTASASGIVPYSSDYLNSYFIGLFETNTPGEVKLGYSVVATGDKTSVGISDIWVYTIGGEEVDHIVGTKANGLIASYSSGVMGNYYYSDNLEAGQYYYMVVRVFAADSHGSDSRLKTTDAVMA